MNRQNILRKENSIRLEYIIEVLSGALIATVLYYQLDSVIGRMVIGSIPVLLLSAYLMQRTTRVFDIRRITIPAFWYLTYLPMIYFPSFVVFYRLDAASKYPYFFAVQSVMITVPLGIWAVNRICRFDQNSIRHYFNAPVQERKPGIAKLFIYTVLLSVALFFAIIYIIGLDNIPLLYMFKNPGASQEVTVLREESFKLLDPRWSSASSTHLFYIYLFLRTLIFPFFILLSFGYFFISRDLKWFFLFIITLIAGVIYAATSLARAPVAAIFLRLSFAFYLIKQGRLGKKMLVVCMVLILLFPLMVTKLGYGTNVDALDAIKRVFIRLCYTPAADLHDYFEIFPEHHDYVYGQALLKPILILFGLPNFYIENYVYRFKYPNSIETGHSNAAFQSNLHADFGALGVLIGGFLTGMLMQGIQIYILRRKKTIVSIASYSFFIYAFWVLNMGSITSVLFVNGVIPVVFLILLFLWLEDILIGAVSR
jgi:hypothetical protein